MLCGLLALTLGSAAPRAGGDDVHVMVSGAFTAAYKTLVAEWARRVVRLRDGRVESDVRNDTRTTLEMGR